MTSTSPHILVVADEADVRDLIQTYLAQQGYRVSAAWDGECARRVLAQDTVDRAAVSVSRIPYR